MDHHCWHRLHDRLRNRQIVRGEMNAWSSSSPSPSWDTSGRWSSRGLAAGGAGSITFRRIENESGSLGQFPFWNALRFGLVDDLSRKVDWPHSSPCKFLDDGCLVCLGSLERMLESLKPRNFHQSQINELIYQFEAQLNLHLAQHTLFQTCCQLTPLNQDILS